VVSVLHELGMALHSDQLLIVRAGRVAHVGITGNAATHAALREVFEQRISLHEVDSQWVVLPR
jgi:iron complex transport system ATP-binding protein